MKTRNNAPENQIPTLKPISADEAWKLSNALDQLGTCLWEIFHYEFMDRCCELADIPAINDDELPDPPDDYPF